MPLTLIPAPTPPRYRIVALTVQQVSEETLHIEYLGACTGCKDEHATVVSVLFVPSPGEPVTIDTQKLLCGACMRELVAATV